MDWIRQAFGALGASPDYRAPEEHHAVVAAILRQAPQGAELLLIRRSVDARDPWSGHMALPGGHRDPEDADLLGTAVREISEEIGVDLVRDARLLGRLQGTRAVASTRSIDFTIFPLVFALEREVSPALNVSEVSEVVWAGVDHLLSPSSRSSFEQTIRQQRFRFPAFDVEGRQVWGLTYRILEDLLRVLQPDSGSGKRSRFEPGQ